MAFRNEVKPVDAEQVLGFLNLFVLPQPEVYLGNIMNALDENGKLSNENVQGFLDSFVGSFIQWINKF